MQIEVAALSGTVYLQAPEVVAAVDARAGQGANERAQFLRVVRVGYNPNAETFVTLGDRTLLAAVDESLRQCGSGKNNFIPSRHLFPEPLRRESALGRLAAFPNAYPLR